MQKNIISIVVGLALLFGSIALEPALANSEKGEMVELSTFQEIPVEPLSDDQLSGVEAKGNFTPGYCTWFVDNLSRQIWKLKKGVPWQGDAGKWLTNPKTSVIFQRNVHKFLEMPI